VRYFQAYPAGLIFGLELRRWRFDIVNVFFAGYGESLAVRLMGPQPGTRVNFIAGYPFQQVPHRFHEFRKTGLARRLDAIVVKSAFMVPQVEQFFGRPVEVIPNGVDLDYFQPLERSTDLRHALCANPCPHVLVTVAALEERKGILNVLDVLASLRDQGMPVQYWVVGDGKDRPLIERRVRELNLVDCVALVGSQQDVRPYLAEADVFVLPSRGEGFPNALLEAWAMAKPAIVSRHPPYDELVATEFGMCVDECDVDGFVDALAGLLQDKARRERMGQAARAHVSKHFAWPAVAGQYLRFFAGVIQYT
jgi:glycosyltransferase involved in cell wall biosynthesis